MLLVIVFLCLLICLHFDIVVSLKRITFSKSKCFHQKQNENYSLLMAKKNNLKTSESVNNPSRNQFQDLLDSNDGNDSSNLFESEDEAISNDIFKAKLKAEIASPFYRLRQFAYLAAIIGGGIGTLTTIPQLSMLDRPDSLTNIAIDIGAFIGGIVLFSFDSKRQNAKLDVFVDKEMKMNNRITSEEAIKRSNELSALPVQIQIDEYNVNSTRIVSVGDLQIKGKQNLIIFAGTYEIVKDVILSARIEGSDIFIQNNCVLVPIVLKGKQLDEDESKGFGTKSGLLSASYIAKPTQLNVWEYYLQKEIDLAVKQGEPEILSKGLVLAIQNKTRKIIRRGIGIPPWKNTMKEFMKSDENK